MCLVSISAVRTGEDKKVGVPFGPGGGSLGAGWGLKGLGGMLIC